MNEKQLDKRKWMSFLWILAGALLAEVLVCNFPAWKSLFLKNRMVFEEVSVEGGTQTNEGTHEYVVDEGELTLHLPEVASEIDNLLFALDFSEEEPVPYTVTLTDGANYYPYSLPEKIMMPGIKKTFYTNIYPSGKVNEITVQLTVPAGSVVTVNGIGVNARIPFVFSLGSFLIIMGAFLLFYGVSIDAVRDTICKRNRKQNLITVLVVMLLMALAWKLCHVNPVCIASPWPHHKQYQELAEAIKEGHFYLDAEPSEGLLHAENPYDTIYLQANGIDYKADYAYFEGKYYVYFGVVPEVLLYLPCYILTGHHLPNYIAVYLFYCGFIVTVFALFAEMVKRWFSRTPFSVYLIVSTLTVLAGNYLFVIARPDLYDTPIMAANMFTASGLWLWIKGKYAETGKSRRICYLLGSLSMALVAGCRPQMLLFSFLAIPLFWEEVIKKRVLFGKREVWDTVCICLPYAVVAAAIMYYNGARFGSPFDFGATYSLTSNDMTKRSFNLHQALLGLWHYFIKPPVITSDFPFLQGVQITSDSYMGRLNAEYTYGGIIAGNIFLWILLCFNRGRAKLKEKGIYVFAVMSAAISVVLCLVDVTGAGILQRYMVDMIWGVWLAAVLLFLGMMENAAERGKQKTVLLLLAVICLLQMLYGFGVVFGNGDLSVNVRTSNPELYYRVKSLLMF